jgi:hypothetical protein
MAYWGQHDMPLQHALPNQHAMPRLLAKRDTVASNYTYPRTKKEHYIYRSNVV